MNWLLKEMEEEKCADVLKAFILMVNNTHHAFECMDIDNEEFINVICKETGLPKRTYMRIMGLITEEYAVDVYNSEGFVRRIKIFKHEATANLVQKNICARFEELDKQGRWFERRHDSKNFRPAIVHSGFGEKEKNVTKYIDYDFDNGTLTKIERRNGEYFVVTRLTYNEEGKEITLD